MKSLELKIPPLVWVLSFAVCIWLCSDWFPSFRFTFAGAKFLGLLVAFLGLGLAVSGILVFQKAQTTVNPLRPGDAAALVRGGPYRFTRNPMYLGMLFVLFGWSLALQNACGFVFLPIYVLILTELQIRPEEKFLVELFGQEYNDYRCEVPRWLGLTN